MIYSFIVMANRIVITIVTYNPKTFIVQATDRGIKSLNPDTAWHRGLAL